MAPVPERERELVQHRSVIVTTSVDRRGPWLSREPIAKLEEARGPPPDEMATSADNRFDQARRQTEQAKEAGEALMSALGHFLTLTREIVPQWLT